MPTVRSKAEQQVQKTKLANSYNELLKEFSSKDLHTVGNYSLGRLIGKGSFGKVYLASHKLINGSKVVLKSANKDDGNLAREIHHHRQFLHPHIARLYEVIVTENLVWLTLEYCPGDELYNYLLQHGPLPTDKVQKVFTQLVGAVAYVHDSSCVHRDLKLENILLDKNENVKLCDFGFTREYDSKASYLQTFCGTVCYSAPEMLKGERYAAEKVDVWSLGIILYALLAGELPFDDDDEMTTKHRILSEEPKYPSSFPVEAKGLITEMLSKRPLLRPQISEILMHSFLMEHAPQQQAILKLTQPAPFSTDLEKVTLERMRSAGVNIDKVIESVLAQRCDSLAGWWAILIEKEQRKEKRRELKRREKEAEAKTLRRQSAASSRLERLTPTLKDLDENEAISPTLHSTNSRGRRDRRSTPTPQLLLPELPRLPEGLTLEAPESPTPPPPIEKDPVPDHSIAVMKPRPIPFTGDRRRSGGSNLHLVSSNPDLLAPPHLVPKRGAKKHQHYLLNQLTTFKHWFKGNAKRAKSPASKVGGPDSKSSLPHRLNAAQTPRPSQPTVTRAPAALKGPTPTRQPLETNPMRSQKTTPRHRSSLSPAPITPRSSYRLSVGPTGLRGRKSTSSSISSIRSIHHLPSHSKASSTSSTTNSIHSSVPFSKTSHSPHSSVKVLPSTPTLGSFPSNIRVVRAPPIHNEYAAIRSPAGHVFAKRKKTPFRGPHLTIANSPGTTAIGRGRDTSAPVSRSASIAGRRSGEIIEEEDEDEVEEVDAFSPIAPEVDETVWGSETKISENLRT